MLSDIFTKLVNEQRQPFKRQPPDFAELMLGIAWEQSSCLGYTNHCCTGRQNAFSLFCAVINVQGNVVGSVPLSELIGKGRETLTRSSRQTMGLWLPHPSCGSE